MGVGVLRRTLVRRINIAAGLFLAVLCVVGVLSLWFEVQRRLDLVALANSENGRWSLAQLEVELLRLLNTIAADEPDLGLVRLQFDILYSRIDILATGRAYRNLRSMPDFARSLDGIHGFIDGSIPAIDAPDPELRQALPGMETALEGLGKAARQMSVAGNSYFGGQSDTQRAAMARTLRRFAAMTALMVFALSVLATSLLRLNRRSATQAEDNRRTSARLETVVATSVDGIVVVDRKGKVLEFNPAAETILGYSRAEAVGGDVAKLFFPPDAIKSTLRMIETQLIAPEARHAGKQRIEIDMMRKDRSIFPVELSVASVERADGGIFIAFLRDISARRQDERDLTEARDRALEGEKTKADFLAVMSHEMRTPLNGLLGSAEVLGVTQLDPRQRELLDVIETTGQILLHHVNSVLDISSAEAGAIRPERVGFNLEALVREAVANQSGLAAAARNLIAIQAVGDPVGRVTGDPGRLRQILLNLVGNAVKFTRDGVITVEIDAFPPRSDVRLVEIRVIDSGIGIAEADLDRVFQDFVTLDSSYGRATGGTGLGLGITRRLVEAMDGEIGVESELGEGSVFWVRLPFGVDAPGTAAVPQSGAKPAIAGPGLERTLSVLVIEDNPINRFVLRNLLEEAGHRVNEAVDGLDGIALAEAEAHDVILMDISMPKMDGIEATRRIRAGDGPSRDARIIAVTAHALPDDRERFQVAGMSGCLIKPITRGALAGALTGAPGPDLAEAALPLLDSTLIDDLVAQLGPRTTLALTGRFLKEGNETVARLATPIPDGEARLLCHRLAGSASTFGARRLGERLRRIETALSEGSDASAAVAGLFRLWEETQAAITLVCPALAEAG